MNRERARQIVDRFEGRRLVVAGDLMLDRFVWGVVRRISPEAPVPVVEVQRESEHLGGAGNVVANLVALGAHAWPLGVTGDDGSADLIEREFGRLGVEAEGVVRDASRPTTTKTRVIAHHQQVVRADREERRPVAPAIETALASRFEAFLERADSVVVSDYDKGLLGGDLLGLLLRSAANCGLPLCLDPKVRRFAAYKPVTLITPNHHEAAAATGLPGDTDAEVEACGLRIQEMLGGPAVLITRGENGMTLVDGAVSHISTTAREVYDVTGAGDTVIATLALALAAGATCLEAAVLANLAAGIVVGKLGTATASRKELIEAVESTAF